MLFGVVSCHTRWVVYWALARRPFTISPLLRYDVVDIHCAGLFAAAVHWPFQERPVPRLSVANAA